MNTRYKTIVYERILKKNRWRREICLVNHAETLGYVAMTSTNPTQLSATVNLSVCVYVTQQAFHVDSFHFRFSSMKVYCTRKGGKYLRVWDKRRAKGCPDGQSLLRPRLPHECLSTTHPYSFLALIFFLWLDEWRDPQQARKWYVQPPPESPLTEVGTT